MNALEATLAAYSARDGVAYRLTNFRHRHLASEPIALSPFQPGGEPFAVAALAYGTGPGPYQLALAGQPLDRVQLFESLLPAARWFNTRFEAPWGLRQHVTRGVRNPREVELAPDAPQVIVTNPGVVKFLSSMGRRLAFLPTEATEGGPPPAPPELVRLGRHLVFATRRYREPGQQVLLDMTTLAGATWATAQTPAERANLAALFAWVERPGGLDGFTAAFLAEGLSAGPIPNPSAEDEIIEMVERLGEARKAGDRAGESDARAEVEAAYRALLDPVWDLLWRVRAAVLEIPEEARYMTRRLTLDAEAYSQHMAWMDGPTAGRRRTRDTVPQAIWARRKAEAEAAMLEAEETISDPLRLIPLLLDHKAVEGAISERDFDRSEVKHGNRRASAAPRLELRTANPSLMPVGKELWWADDPGRVCAEVRAVEDDPAGPGSLVDLVIVKGATLVTGLRTAQTACFSELTTDSFPATYPSQSVPFTHVPAQPDSGPDHIEPEGDQAPAVAP